MAMAIMESPSGKFSFDEIITELNYAYRDGDKEEIAKWEALYERSLNELDDSYRTEQMHNENRFYLGD